MIKLKPSVQKLQAYYVNDLPYKVKLDANEGNNYLLEDKLIFDDFKPNFYPDSDSKILREKMSIYYGCKAENILVGNGSSELINMVINAYCEKNDKVMSFVPSFSMYQTYCDLCGADYVGIKAEYDFTQNIDKLINTANKIKPKIVILCNPNNPTGYVTPKKEIVKLLNNVKNSIIILDEAYADFSEITVIDLIKKYENLIVMRTLSKAFGLAGLRVGAMIANENLVEYIWKVKIPYNINVLSQYAANKALDNIDKVNEHIQEVKKLRYELCNNLKKLGFTIFPTGSNFIFIEQTVDNLYEKLVDCGVLIRKFVFNEKVFYRITVGTKEENEILLKEIYKIMQETN
ncbi:histidinol-phosphate transaminase [Sedimentibacter sp. MB31-C6]|uniref:histidinol-phosphate transaminase n=1 Tax=Sedimentibacter sp. MB31-C6 TaxID=3109366 RepID=UPI002DDD66B9|nr:histidinol-phosphate transaminase [Sedimentibacter sp. MB36-C1]WSI05436.1 histidinol-phosphate transaminase [Sedimentibacter sp. MB36-C1]